MEEEEEDIKAPHLSWYWYKRHGPDQDAEHDANKGADGDAVNEVNKKRCCVQPVGKKMKRIQPLITRCSPAKFLYLICSSP
jgi:hypothetical protein